MSSARWRRKIFDERDAAITASASHGSVNSFGISRVPRPVRRRPARSLFPAETCGHLPVPRSGARDLKSPVPNRSLASAANQEGAMSGALAHLESVLAGIRDDGLYKVGRVIADPQGARIAIEENGATDPAVNLCANN